MNSARILAPSLLAAALVSCASQKTGEYDASNPYGASDGGQITPSPTEPANPVYDTPAAYEESTASPSTAAIADVSAAPAPTHTPAPVAHANAPAIIHTVAKGDTLSGISAKYKIPAASIKQANRMTSDTVVLGRKMVIPPR